MEVEHENESAALEHDDLVVLVLPRDVAGVVAGQPAVLLLGDVHGAVPVVEELVLEQVALHQAPLAAGVVERLVVADAREVKPLRMAELVADEVEVRLAAESVGDQADHLMQRHAPVDDQGRWGIHSHLPVHLLVHQPERQSFVPDERLVVRLRVRDRLLLPPAVTQRVNDVADAPILVRLFLQHFDPLVGDRHAQTVVEPTAALVERTA